MAINITEEYNILNDCKYIRNQDACLNDSNMGYEVLFNQDNAGWDTYTNLVMTSAPGFFLWATATDTQCAIGRSTNISNPFEADYFGIFEVDMIVKIDPLTTTPTPSSFTSRIQWRMQTDLATWPTTAYLDFDVIPDGVWHRYKVNLLQEQLWVGTCNNFILYPILDGWVGTQFMIKRFAFTSDTNYKCKQAACAGHTGYSHPCPYIGTYATARSLSRRRSLSISDATSRMGVSIDGYPPKYIDIDLNHATDPLAIAQSITMKLNLIGIGGYKFAQCTYDEINEVFTIFSGTRGRGGSVAIYQDPIKDMAAELGFFDSEGNQQWTFIPGTDAADGFIPRFYFLPATLLYRLPSSATTIINYDPTDPLVEIGRSDVATCAAGAIFPEGYVVGHLMIDIFGRATYDGTLNQIQFKGDLAGDQVPGGLSKVFLLRPTSDFSYVAVGSVILVTADADSTNTLYTATVDWDCRPGDVLGLWQCLPAVDGAANVPPEQLYKYSWAEQWLPNLQVGDSFTFTQKYIRFYGYESLPVYGKSAATMRDIGIEAELRYEYGVSSVAVVGAPYTNTMLLSIMDLDGTQIGVGTSTQPEVITNVADANLNIVPTANDTYIFINLWFPHIIQGIAHTTVYFTSRNNFRSFCWEWYVEPQNHTGVTWGTTYPSIQTTAPLYGDSAPWLHMLNPAIVLADGATDYSGDLYLGWNYVTDNAQDYFPGLTEDEQQGRLQSAQAAYWNQLDQVWAPGINTRALRLYCWEATDSSIVNIEVYAAIPESQPLLLALNAVGVSGPLVFSTEHYDVIDVMGSKYQSSRISRVQTQDYIYGMEFVLQDDGYTAIAPVGTTLSKLQITIGGLAAQVQQIKIIPQHLAVQIKGAGKEPLQEITDLVWAMPSDATEYTYGPTRSYQICNDRSASAKLLLGVMSPLAVNEACVFSSSLASYDALAYPARGLTSHLIEASDYLYTNDRAINYRSIVYGVVPVTPSGWYSSTTSGVWQTLTSGSPFPTTTQWSEPPNPYRPEWKIYNWAKAQDITVTTGNLNFMVSSRTLQAEGAAWRNVTYFQSTSKSEYFLLETQVAQGLPRLTNVDATAGLVLFDNTDHTKYIRIERYSGNNITTSGSVGVPFGDYVSYGPSTAYNVSGGFSVVDAGAAADYGLLLRMAKNQCSLETAYRSPWGTWVTTSAYDISGWSDDLRIGLFAGAVDRVGDASEQTISTAFNYVAYKQLANRVTDFFDYSCDFNTLVETDGLWSAYNAHNAEILRSSPSGIYILRYLGGGGRTVFDNTLATPALGTTWGGTQDQGTVLFNINGFSDRLLASGIYSAGVLLRDDSNTANYVQFNLRSPTTLEMRTPVGSLWVPLVIPVTSASGVWVRLHKIAGMYVPAYSYDGLSFTAVSGYRLTNNWSAGYLSLVFSTDLPEVSFSNLQLGNTTDGATNLMAQFDPPYVMYNIWGQGTPWSDLMYSAAGIDQLSYGLVDEITYLSFAKDPTFTVDTNAVQFVPDPWKSYSLGYSSATYEIASACELLFDRTARPMASVPQAVSGVTSWGGAAATKGMPQQDYPLLIVDLGRSYQIGRTPLVDNSAQARFSRSVTGLVTDVKWDDPVSLPAFGFQRPCLLSSNNQCTLDPSYGKPVMTYTDGQNILKYYAGACDGLNTPAGPVYEACPFFSLGNVRWMLLETTNYVDLTISGGSLWFFAPITGHPLGQPYPLTDYDPWWVADYGQMFWGQDASTGERNLIWVYPGSNNQGSCYFNALGSAYWRLPSDYDWTFEDSFSIDMKAYQGDNLNNLALRVGRDPSCYFEFTLSGTLSENWQTYTWWFKDARRFIGSMQALAEPFYTSWDPEYYDTPNLPYAPMPFLNTGYVEITASGAQTGADIYFKNIRNTRNRFVDEMLFLGVNDSLYIPDLDLTNTGTIELDYYPAEAAVHLIDGEPRNFIYCVFTVSNNEASFAVILHPYWGWNVYCHTPLEQYRATFLPVYDNAVRMLPTAATPGPFHLVFTWAPDKIPGRTDNVVLWVNGMLACSQTMQSMAQFFTKKDMKLTLGRGVKAFDLEELGYSYAAYAKFANLNVYKYAVPFPQAQIANQLAIPEYLLELSQDGENWASLASGTLPLISPQVVPGDCVTFYMRNRRPRRDIKELQKRNTAFLSTMWEVTA